MTNFVPDLIISCIILLTIASVHLISNAFYATLGESVVPAGASNELTLTELIEKTSPQYSWVVKLVINCFGYSCIFVPGIIIYKYTKATKYLDRIDATFLSKTVRFCFSSTPDLDRSDAANSKHAASKRTFVRECTLLCYCLFGLMGSYLTWGVLQEQIMTQEYADAEGKKAHFKDSQFLVFTNRVLGFLITAVYLITKNKLKHRAPLFKYSFASFSNIMSAWFQYEALKFVNFPTQVLAKSCKIIPVMIMGKIISRNKYEFYEYLTAVMISFGMIFFLTGSADESKKTAFTTITGVFLLTMYMIFDSFTSNWQGELFKTYQMSSIQMMCGVNLFSTLFTATSLVMQGGFYASMQFAIHHPQFVMHCVVLSISSAVGQLFIFYTIATFGPVVFTIIMTLRQAIAILLSCLIYKHSISFLGIVGIVIVFLAIFLRVYCNQRLKSIKRRYASMNELSTSTNKIRLNV